MTHCMVLMPDEKVQQYMRKDRAPPGPPFALRRSARTVSKCARAGPVRRDARSRDTNGVATRVLLSGDRGYAVFSAASTFCGENGTERSRAPVASKIAFAMAEGTTAAVGSP